MKLRAAGLTLQAFATAMVRASWLRDRAALEAWQRRQLQAWLRDCASGARLSDLPFTDRSTVIAGFLQFNPLGLTAETATAIAEGHAALPHGYHIGLSTGTTSGQRMPYVISEKERFLWLGTILAKCLGLEALRRPRVAVVLPRGSALYDAAGEGRALPLCFISLAEGFSPALSALTAFQPEIIVAPPRLLRWLVEQKAPISPRRIFAAAEVLDPQDRAAIRTGFPKASLGEIYMATEGLFAVTCRNGTLHLAEDCLHFDLDPAGDGTVEPVITDFTRRAQRMARYRTGDLLRVVGCSCGSPLRAIVVAGRMADRIEGRAPDLLRDAVLGAGAPDFRLIQHGKDDPLLSLPPGTDTERPRIALENLLQRRVRVETGHLTLPQDAKLRRVMRIA